MYPVSWPFVAEGAAQPSSKKVDAHAMIVTADGEVLGAAHVNKRHPTQQDEQRAV